MADKLADAIVGVSASFIISTGDNIYPNGVSSEYDPQWRSAFEDVYTRHATFIKWYVTLGNHDYKTNPDAEIAYTKISRRWYLPLRYFSVAMGAGKYQIVGVVKNFYFETLHNKIDALAIFVIKDTSVNWITNTAGCLFLKVFPNVNS